MAQSVSQVLVQTGSWLLQLLHLPPRFKRLRVRFAFGADHEDFFSTKKRRHDSVAIHVVHRGTYVDLSLVGPGSLSGTKVHAILAVLSVGNYFFFHSFSIFFFFFFFFLRWAVRVMSVRQIERPVSLHHSTMGILKTQGDGLFTSQIAFRGYCDQFSLLA